MKKFDVAIAIILTAIIAGCIGWIAGVICEAEESKKIYNHVMDMAEEDMNRAIEETLDRLYENA